MKWVLIVVVVLVFAVSFFADYKWRKWIADRRRERGNPGQNPAQHRD